MTTCDICGAIAVMLVSCKSNGFGGDPAYGSFRSNRCDDHGRQAVDEHKRNGFYDVKAERFASPAIVALPGGDSMRFGDVVKALREKSACVECGKSTLVFNVATRGFRGERVTLESHCACAGGPAHHLVPMAVAS